MSLALPPSVPHPLRDMLAGLQSARDHSAFDATALRTRSAPAREVLAWLASNGRFTLDAILFLARETCAASDSDAAVVWRDMPSVSLLRLARIMAMQDIFPGDLGDAHAIFQAVLKVHGTKRIQGRHANLALQVALSMGDYAAAMPFLSLLPRKSLERRYALCDLANPFIDSRYASAELWHARVNELLAESGAPPIVLDGEPVPSPFDALGSKLESATMDGPLVTIAVSSWCPDETLVTAIRSLVDQTWRNLEILVVDDASPPEHDRVLEAAQALDPGRIRILRQERNGGTYVARNRALGEAKGEYFTVHDSDDWAHPARIERQVKDLVDTGGRIANYCTGLRADENLRFSMPGVSPFRTNESSLLFHTQSVLPGIGFYDPSRKGADTEYSIRMRRVFGEDAVGVLGQILSFIRLSRDSLSRSEFRAGWRHPARAAYRRSFEAWHDRSADLRLANPDPARWKFARPGRFESLRTSPPTFDAVFVGDYRLSSPFADLLVDEVAAMAQAGRKVGIVHLDSFARLSPIAVEAYPVALQELLLRRQVVELDLEVAATAHLLVVAEPELLVYQTPLRTRIDADRVLLLPRPAMAATCEQMAYEPGACEQACRALFGRDPEWVRPTGGDPLLVGQGRRRWTMEGWPAVVFAPHWAAPVREPLEGREPVLAFELEAGGRGVEQLERLAVLRNRRMKVWVGNQPGMSPPSPLPRGWHVYPQEVVPCATFLAQVDFWLNPLPPDREGARPLETMRAMAAGCVAILHPGWQVQFGEAGVYATAPDLDLAIQALVADQPRCARLQTQALASVGEQAGASAFDARIRAL